MVTQGGSTVFSKLCFVPLLSFILLPKFLCRCCDRNQMVGAVQYHQNVQSKPSVSCQIYFEAVLDNKELEFGLHGCLCSTVMLM